MAVAICLATVVAGTTTYLIAFGKQAGASDPVGGLAAREASVAGDPAPAAPQADDPAAGALRLAGASLNVVRDERAGFNVAYFLQSALASAARSGAIPAISLRQSRINFRSGTVKSAYYLNDVELDLQPPRRPGEELRWQYEASPARTDRQEQGFGRFTGSGRWIPGSEGGRFAIDVALERSAVA